MRETRGEGQARNTVMVNIQRQIRMKAPLILRMPKGESKENEVFPQWQRNKGSRRKHPTSEEISEMTPLVTLTLGEHWVRSKCW